MNLRISALALFWGGVLMFGMIILLVGLAETVNNSVFDELFAVLVASGILSLLASFVQAWRSRDNRILLSLAILALFVGVGIVIIGSTVSGEGAIPLFLIGVPVSIFSFLFFLILYFVSRRRVIRSMSSGAITALAESPDASPPTPSTDAVQVPTVPVGIGLGVKVLITILVSGLIALVLAFLFHEFPFVEGYSNLFLFQLTPLFSLMVVAFHFLKQPTTSLVRSIFALCLVFLFAFAGYLFYAFHLRLQEFNQGVPYFPQLPVVMLPQGDAAEQKSFPSDGTLLDGRDGWNTYHNEERGFEFRYPPTLFVARNPYGDGETRGWFITQEDAVPIISFENACGTAKDYMSIYTYKDFTAVGMQYRTSDEYMRVLEENYASHGGRKVYDAVSGNQRIVRFEADRVYGSHFLLFKDKQLLDVSYQKCAGGVIPFDAITSTVKFTK